MTAFDATMVELAARKSLKNYLAVTPAAPDFLRPDLFSSIRLDIDAIRRARLVQAEHALEKAVTFFRERWQRRHVSRTADLVVPAAIQIIRSTKETKSRILRQLERSTTS